EFSRIPISPITQAGLQEALVIADRLNLFLALRGCTDILPSPPFEGCGWLNNAEGDILAGNMLIEIKAGERPFRSIDLRQVLCYGALNFSSRKYEITEICLVNPRLGIYLQQDLETLCEHLAGASASEVLSEIVAYISEPFGRYRTG